MPNKNKRRKEKSSSQGQHHESPSDSGSLNRKAKSPIRSHVASKAVCENSVQSVCSSNELSRMNSEKSDVLTTHSSLCGQENASGNSCSSSYVSSALLQTLLEGNLNVNVKAKFKTQLNERTKCCSCGKTNILIGTDIEDFGNYILKLLEENNNLKLENASLKSKQSKLPDEVFDLSEKSKLSDDVFDLSHQMDAGQDNLNSVVYPDSANVCSVNTMEMEIEEGASAVAVIEPCSSQNHQKGNKTWESSKKGNNRRSDNRKYETESSASTQGNGSVEMGNDSTLPGNNVDNGSWYQEEDINVASGGSDLNASVGSKWTGNNGAGAGSQDYTNIEATAYEKYEGNPKELRSGNYDHGDDLNAAKSGWRTKEDSRNRPNRSGDHGVPSEEKSRRGSKDRRNRPSLSGDRGDPSEEKSRWGSKDHKNRPSQGGDPSEEKSRWGSKDHRNRPSQSGDRGGHHDYAAGGKRGGGKLERTYKVVEETFGDLFMAPEDHSLAHCVAEDMRMGSGIAVTFRQMFKNVEILLEQGKRSGQVAVLEHKGRFIYYLVTKKVSNGKPRLDDLVSSVVEMKQHCVDNRVTKIAMPRIGCGLDRLEWSTVKNVLEDTFSDTDVHIIVYNFQQGHGKHSQSNEKQLSSPDSVVSGKENHKKKKEKPKKNCKKSRR
ncbi:uncharacterized protein [Anabrus simplex]|uniref:uncharacterized protein isoform X2 n=1 Tax=Anabrus simplex TaxID=316456 RepID=UPI0035A330BB